MVDPREPVPLSYEAEPQPQRDLGPIPPWLRVLRIVLLVMAGATLAVLMILLYAAYRRLSQPD